MNSPEPNFHIAVTTPDTMKLDGLSLGSAVQPERNALKKVELPSSAWLSCICVVHFDFEYGQVLEYAVPSLSLTEDERRNICFLAFPDSNSLVSEDTIFSFRIRTGSNSSSPTFQYGYVFFRQKRDEKLARGFLQWIVAEIGSAA
jgi:hypothetical protein